MAAPSATNERNCALCLSSLKGRSYRNINSKTSVEQYGTIFLKLNVSCSGLCCNICFNKLNRICTLTNEEQSRIAKIRLEKDQLFEKLKELPGVSGRQTIQNATPSELDSLKVATMAAPEARDEIVELQNRYDGCLIRGLPIGVPFKYRVLIPPDKTHTLRDNSDIFIIVSYRAITENKFVDISPPKKIIQKSLDIEHEDTGLEERGHSASAVTSENVDVEESILEKRRRNARIIDDPADEDEVETEAVFLRTFNDRNNDRSDSQQSTVSTDVDIEGVDSEVSVDIVPEDKLSDKTQHDDEPDESTPKRKKRKTNEFAIQFETPVKVKSIEDEETDNTRRKSSRLRSVGYRPDYSAMETKVDGYLSDSGSSAASDNDDYSSSDVDEINPAEYDDPDFDPDDFAVTYVPKHSSKKSEANEAAEAMDINEESDGSEDAIGSDEELSDNSAMKITEKRKKKADQKVYPKKEKKERIRIHLADHTDKYRIDKRESHARKDRGKTAEEASIEVMVCTLCEEFSSSSTLGMETHIEQHLNKDLNCDKCDFVARTVGEKRIHRNKAHKVNLIICFVCGEETFGNNSYRRHMGVVHNDPQYDCKLCAEDGEQKKFVTTKTLRKHYIDDHKDKLLKCPDCPSLFAAKCKLTEHRIRGCPSEEHTFTCEVCGRMFPTQSILNRHKRVVHDKMRTHKCPQCSFVAVGACILRKHMRTHEGYHPYQCEICAFSCGQRCQLSSHMRTHTGDKPYKCEKCKYAAAWKVQLKEHLKAHDSGEAVTCDSCDIVFKNAKTLGLHTKREHSS